MIDEEISNLTVIDALIRQKRPFAVYRIPGEKLPRLLTQAEENIRLIYDLQELNGQKGFVIAPFRVSEMCPVILIQSDGWGQSLSLDDDTEEEYEASLQIQEQEIFQTSYTKEYAGCFQAFINALRDGTFDKLVSLLLIGGHIFVLGRYYYKSFDAREKRTHGMTLYICLLSTILLAVGTNNLLNQLGLPDELSAGFSISLSLAGFMQMAVGMRLHLKVVRMISLATFSIVLLKLVMVDLWLLPTIGKVVVFIILGVILLILSFLYQKLKTVLFDDSL